MRLLTETDIRQALDGDGIEVTFKYDYNPPHRLDKYEEVDFSDRAWRVLLLIAANRRKSSRQLNETQTEIKRKRLDEHGLRVRVLTMDAALRLQGAGYELERIVQHSGEPCDGSRGDSDSRIRR